MTEKTTPESSPAESSEREPFDLVKLSASMSAFTVAFHAYNGVDLDTSERARTALAALPEQVVRTLRDASAAFTELANERLGA